MPQNAPYDKLTPAQRRLLNIANTQGWVRPTAANDLRTAKALVHMGLLKPHPAYDGDAVLVISPTSRAGEPRPSQS